MALKIVALSDTHCRLRKFTVPEGDLLIHAGDLTFRGDIQEISQELRELGRIAKNFKQGCLLTPGNHDWLFERNWDLAKQMCIDEGITLLHQEGIRIEGINIWMSAFSPAFCNWAFNVDRLELKEKWAPIPDNTNILVTHGPPMGILDKVDEPNGHGENVGCYDLYNRIQELPNLTHHIFGHIHENYRQLTIGNVTYINASNCTEEYKPINKPIVFEV